MSRRFEGFTARLNERPAAVVEANGDDVNPLGEMPNNSTIEENIMSESKNEEAIASATSAGHTTGFKAATDRMTAVFASEHYPGREAVAGKLLTKASLLSATSDDIIDLMADMPKIDKESSLSEADQKAAAEEAARAEMKAELEKNKNSETNADGGQIKATGVESAAVWDAAIARVSA